MKSTTAWAIMWIAVALGVSVGIYITRSVLCLCAFFIPAIAVFPPKNDKEDY